jgi:hypothetical protein
VSIIVFAAVARWRRPILLVTLPVAVVFGVLRESSDRGVWFPVFVVGFGSFLVLLTLALIAAFRYHPAVLVARPQEPAFAARPNPAWVFLAAIFLFQGGSAVADNIHDIMQGEALWGLSAILAGLWVFLLILYWRLTWGWVGVQLRPDGVYDRQPLGSLFVPWDAFVRAYPAAPRGTQQVALYYERPELVRRRGLRRGGPEIPAASIDTAFLARTINEYVAHPEYRSAIGTEAELRRLTAATAG